jgi:single-strand DNA-binding protein
MAIAKFTIAVNRITRAGEENTADFIRVTAFGKQAELVERYLAKGSKVGIEGRIQTGSYDNKDGQKVYTTDVIANRVEFLDRKGERAEGGQSSSSYDGQHSEPLPFPRQQPPESGPPTDDFSLLDDADDDLPF